MVLKSSYAVAVTALFATFFGFIAALFSLSAGLNGPVLGGTVLVGLFASFIGIILVMKSRRPNFVMPVLFVTLGLVFALVGLALAVAVK